MSRALAECRVRTGDHRLYGEDSDWNTVIRDVTHAEVEHEQARSDFEAGFGQLPTEVAIRGIQPKVSTVIYRSSDLHWDPNGVYEVFDETALLTKRIAINTSEKVAWFVTAEETPVRWGGRLQHLRRSCPSPLRVTPTRTPACSTSTAPTTTPSTTTSDHVSLAFFDIMVASGVLPRTTVYRVAQLGLLPPPGASGRS